MRRTVVTIGACVCLAALVAVMFAQAPKQPSGSRTIGDSTASGSPVQSLEMAVNTSRIVTREHKIPRLLVENPSVAQAKPIAPNQVQLFGVTAGFTKVTMWDEKGQEHSVDVRVYGDAQEPDFIRCMRTHADTGNSEWLREMLRQWKAAANESDRGKFEKQMREALTAQFQARLGASEKEILQLEAKVKQLREQLEVRRKKQDEIVDFRLKQLLREAQGLGWGADEGAIQSRSTPQANSIRALEELRKVAPASEVFIKSRESSSGAQVEDRDALKR